MLPIPFLLFFFFNDTATTEIYTLSLHDALPISCLGRLSESPCQVDRRRRLPIAGCGTGDRQHMKPEVLARQLNRVRSEEHTSELQSLAYLVCRLLLEKKKRKSNTTNPRAS